MAQNATSGAIQGLVRDQTGKALGGVTVIVTSPSLQGEQGAVTDETGQYKITNLPPGTYMAKFYFDKAETRRTNIIVNINKTTPGFGRIDLTKAKGEVIEITAKAPSIDPTSTTQGITLGQDYTRNIPVPGRTFESALGAAAGSAGDDLGVSFSGSTSLENSYVVDGVNTTGLTYGTVGSPLINDFIQEIEIITGGYNAEYGRATGGVVNVVTKSGSNEFHGQVFTYITPGFAIAERERTPTQGSSIDFQSNVAYNMDFGFDLGGPIIKDKVWFYVGFAPRLFRTDVDVITKRRTDCRMTMPNGELSTCDPVNLGDGTADEDPNTGFLIYEELDRSRRNASQTTYQFVSKINFAVSPEHQGQVSLIGTPSSGQTAGGRGDPLATTFDYTQLTTDLSVKWTSKFNNNKTEVEAVLGWHRSTVEADSIDNSRNGQMRQNLYFGTLDDWSMLNHESARTNTGCRDSADRSIDPFPLIDNCPDVGLGYSIGGPGGVQDNKEERLSARVGVTQRVKAMGNHEIKAGIDIEDNNLNDLRNISGGVYYDLLQANDVAAYNQVYALRWIRLAPTGFDPAEFQDNCGRDADGNDIACTFLGPNDVVGNTTNWSAYIRDSWQIKPNLTFNYGVRYEEQRLRFAKHLQNTLDPFTGDQLGTNAMTMKNMWAPRLGLLYDWTKEGRSKIYGHWGRFYESIPMDINNRSFGGETLYQQVFNSSQCGPTVGGIGGPSGPGCTDAGERPALAETLFGSGTLVAPGVKPQFMDEYILGVEYEVMEDLKVGISFQNRRLGRVLEDVSVDNADTYILANPGEWDAEEERKLQAKIDAETDPNEKSRLEQQLKQFQGIRIFDTPKRDYNAVQLTATKRFSKSFFVQASYTYSRTEGNFGGLYNADNGQVDPNITSQYDLIELLSNRDGPLPQDRPHYFKFDGFYKFDFKQAGKVTTGMRFRALSGTPRDALARHYLYGVGESFILPRGSMGRTQFDAGLDLHLSYGRKLGKGMSIEVFTDLFNVFNRQGVFRVSENYTFDSSNPVVGGSFEDLVFAKRLTTSGGETPDPVTRNRNFGNTTVRYSPFSARFGARLTF